MIVIQTEMTLAPGRRSEFTEYFKGFSADVRKKIGCLEYRWFPDVDNLDVGVVVAWWESEEALATHRDDPHHQQHMASLRDRGVVSFKSHYLEASVVDTRTRSLSEKGNER